MARDYAKSKSKTKRKKSATPRKKQGFPAVAVLIVGLIIGAFVGFLAYLKWLPSQKPTSENKPLVEKKPIKQKEETVVPKYQFHELLENKKVVIPEEELQRPENQNNIRYNMPCGSFRSPSMAEELKAKIAFLGFETNILTIETKSGLWYRVQLGPYSSKRRAESIRHKLQNNGINDCKIWGQKI